jgi:hypothetical protein
VEHAHRCDPGRRRSGLRLSPDRPTGQTGRRSPGRQHSRRVPLPHRSRAHLRRSPRRRLDDGDEHRERPLRASAVVQPRPCRPDQPGLRRHDPLFGRFQPPIRRTEVARHRQAQVVNDFVDQILAADPRANIIVLGDINDFEFSQTVEILKGGVLANLMDSLPKQERYSYVFEGNSQVLDQTLVSATMARFPFVYDVVHVNSEFADQASDHEPQVARFDLRARPAPK